MKKSGVLAQAFGVPSSILSNCLIAETASKKARSLKCPVFTQADIRVDEGIGVTYCTEEPGSPPPTLRICRESVRWAQKNGVEEIWIACARPHLWRVMRDLKYAIREVKVEIKVRVCDEVYHHLEEKWFCPDSTQKRTRSRSEWMKRERILMLIPMFIYKRVAA
jgi:hypothetical protein